MATKIRDLPLPIQELALLRIAQHTTDYYSERHRDKTTEEKLDINVDDAFEWVKMPEKTTDQYFWSRANDNRWTDKDIQYAESIVGNKSVEPLIFF